MTDFDDYLGGLDDEILKSQEKGKRPIDLAHGTFLGNYGEDWLYVFEADQEITLADNTPVQLQVDARMVRGSIESKQGYHLFVLLVEYIGKEISDAKLHCEPWFLLEELKQRLASAHQDKHGFDSIFDSPDGLLEPEPPADGAALFDRIQTEYGKPILVNDGQLRAIDHVINSPITFVWGPPGTGKTTTLGLAADCLIRKGARVLIVAHSNAAVDVAALAAAKYLRWSEDYLQGRVLRYGYSDNPLLDDLPRITAKGILAALNSRDAEKIAELEMKRNEYLAILKDGSNLDWKKQMATAGFREANEALKPLHEAMKLREQKLLSGAKITACTLSKAAIDSRIYSQRFDAVLIDEASMAYIPQCLFAASLARCHVSVFGDFRQLPPIVTADTERSRQWLGRDVFQYAGIEAAVNESRTDDRLAVLTEQYRMHPGIVSIINRLYYGGRLTTGEPTARAAQVIADMKPESGSPLVVLNTERFPSYCFSPYRSGSRFNPYSALVAVELAARMLERRDCAVGIVTPFRSQARLLTALTRDQGLGDRIRASTVHLFQGQERDVIIFDPVISQPAERCILMEGGITSSAARLANVAVSRAKGKFILVTNPKCIDDLLMPQDAFRTLILDVSRQAAHHAVSLPQEPCDGVLGAKLKGITWLAPVAFPALEKKFRDDLCSAKQHVLIHYPFAYARHITYQWFTDPAVRARQFITESTDTSVFTDAEIFTPASVSPQRHGAAFGMDGAVLWLLTDPQGAAVRFELKRTVACLYSLLNLAPEGGFESLGMCPTCGEPLWMRLNHTTGDPEIHCAKAGCDYHRRANQHDLTRHARLVRIQCPICGVSMVGRQSQRDRLFLSCVSSPRCRGVRWPRDYI